MTEFEIKVTLKQLTEDMSTDYSFLKLDKETTSPINETAPIKQYEEETIWISKQEETEETRIYLLNSLKIHFNLIKNKTDSWMNKPQDEKAYSYPSYLPKNR